MENAKLKQAYDDTIDLYRVLKFSTRDVPSCQLRKRFRQLSPEYHPDKNPTERETHLRSLAIDILGDKKLRHEYDLWWDQQIALNKQMDQSTRNISKLKRNDMKSTATYSDINITTDLDSIQKYGTYLRKLKHFNLPYHWSQKSPQKPEGQSFWDSSTLRLEIETHDSEVSNKLLECQSLRVYLESLFDVPIHSVYYSTRNRREDRMVVAYAVFQSPPDSSVIYKRYKKQALPSPLKSLEPRIPISYYKRHTKTSLEPAIQHAVGREDT